MTRDHAVVLGAGIGGLLAARVLSDVFARVTVIERDRLPLAPENRRGVPQGRHVHMLQARGAQIAEQFFPGLSAELVASGASLVGDLSQVHFGVDGRLLHRGPQPMAAPLLLQTRPFLERTIRRRVERIAGVTFRDQVSVSRLLSSAASGTGQDPVVTGVQVAPTGGGDTEDLHADLVLDSTGRGSRTPAWLAELGFDRPEDDQIAVRVAYASQLLRVPDGAHPRQFLIEGRSANLSLGITLFVCEQNSWIMSVQGAAKAFPPVVTREWLLETAGSTLPPDLSDLVRRAEPISPIAVQQHPTSIRRRYDRLRRFPTGLIVMGDAICSLNPVYGTGMSVTLEQALALQTTLADRGDDLAHRFFAATAAPIDNAWQLAAGPDLADPDTAGAPGLRLRFSALYIGQVFKVAQRDREVARRFLAVAGLVAPWTALLRPRVLAPVGLGTVRSLLRIARSLVSHPGPSAEDAAPTAPSTG